MRKITPKIQSLLLYLFLVGSFFTSYANAISSFLIPSETDTHVSFSKVSTDEVSPIFQNLITQKIDSDRYLSINISKRAIARFNSSIKNEVNSFEITDLVRTNKLFELFVKPTISGISIPDICKGTTPAVLSYTSTTQSANKYSIVFSAAAKAQGFVDVVDKSRSFSSSGGSLSIAVPANAIAGSYTANFFLSNGSQSDPYVITIK